MNGTAIYSISCGIIYWTPILISKYLFIPRHSRACRTKPADAGGLDTAFRGGSEPIFPDLVGPPVFDNIRQSGGIYLTPANFVAPPFGQIGQLARNAFHGPE